MSDDWSPAAMAADPMKLYRARRELQHQSVNSKYFILGFISSGTYGRVYKAQARVDGGGGGGGLFAIKKFKPDKDVGESTYTGISQSAIREIALNRELVHENVAALREVIFEDKAIHMIFEYAEHDFLQLIHHYSSPTRGRIPHPVLKSLIHQLLNGVLYLHSQHILHRDLKPANVLVSTAGVVKVGDLGLARVVREPLQTLWAGDKVVVTIWYRAPELLLGARHYGRPTDLWAVACVMAELAALRPIFKGEEAKMDAKKGILFQRDQMIKIFDVLGSVKEDEWPSVRDMPEYPAMRALGTYENRLPDWCQKKLGNRELVAYDFMRQMLVYDPAKRLTAETAMKHRWFTDDPLPTANAFATIPTKELPQPRRLTQDDTPSAMSTSLSVQALPVAPATAARAPGPTANIPTLPTLQSHQSHQAHSTLPSHPGMSSQHSHQSHSNLPTLSTLQTHHSHSTLPNLPPGAQQVYNAFAAAGYGPPSASISMPGSIGSMGMSMPGSMSMPSSMSMPGPGQMQGQMQGQMPLGGPGLPTGLSQMPDHGGFPMYAPMSANPNQGGGRKKARMG